MGKRSVPLALWDIRRELVELRPWPAWCIYFLIEGDEVVYVGKSSNLPARIRTHLETIDFDRVFYLRCEKDVAGGLEVEWITRLRPKHNERHARAIALKKGGLP